jgi:uncharacterized delta-60 repeat protein
MRNSGPTLRSLVLAGLLTTSLGAPLLAIDGAPDTTFNGNGRTILDVGSNARLKAVVAQPDGKVVVVGDAKFPTPDDPGNTAFVVARWNADGTRDTTFGPAHTGVVVLEIDLGPVGWRHDGATSVALQPDGKLVVGGFARVSSSQFNAVVVRLTALGNRDLDFGGGDAKVVFPELGDSEGCGVLVRRSGEIVVTPTTFATSSVIVQLTSLGDPDPSFGVLGKSEPFSCGSAGCAQLSQTVELPDGRLLTLGVNGNHDQMIFVRFLGTNVGAGAGALDSTFGSQGAAYVAPPGFAEVNPLGFAIDHAARPVVTVQDPTVSGRTALLRLAGAQPDPSFGNGGWAVFTFQPPGSPGTGIPTAFLLQPDDKPVIAGSALINGTWNFVATRRTTDGKAVDSTFSGGWSSVAFDVGGGLTDMATALGARGGRPVLGGLAQTSSGWLYAAARLDNAVLWSDGFESGTTWFWQTSQP